MSAVDFGFTIDVPVHGEWENVDQVRLSLQTCVATLFQSVDHRDVLAMIAGELLENAVKYVHRTDELTMFRLKLWGTMGGVAYVQVANRVDAEAAHTVLASVAGIRDATSVAEAYCQRLLELSSSPSRLSRLGLLRIAYEGGCELSADVQQGILTITAKVPCAASA